MDESRELRKLVVKLRGRSGPKFYIHIETGVHKVEAHLRSGEHLGEVLGMIAVEIVH